MKLETAQINSSANQTRRFPSNQLRNTAFRKRDGEAAFAAIVRALHEAGLDQAEERGVQGFRDFEVAARRRTRFLAVDDLQIRAAAEALQRRGFHCVAEQDDGVTFVLEPLRGNVFRLVDEADDGNRGRGINRAGGALVVERAIAAGDGRVEGFATFRQTAHGFRNLPE